MQRAFDDEHYRGEYIMATTHAAIRAARGGRPSRSESQSEWGCFVGRFGRGNVCALSSPGVELPSNLDGVVWIEMDAAGAWQLALGKPPPFTS
ncbi:MAG: hypothetical protein DMF87_17250 [Acidobacteria bacterium]|nr:MAG: hypothetical protein DMF87_17250 [Acidobacteriota bacterium]